LKKYHSNLTVERQTHFKQFTDEYEQVRAAEGRGSTDPEFYRALPFSDLSGKDTLNWLIRAKSFQKFRKAVLPPLSKEEPLTILDLGAGNCWLSNRLTLLGHRAIAIDLLTNELDGLGASKFFETEFECRQAEFDDLPFEENFADLAVFNASFHYSENYQKTLVETLRVLNPGGQIVILDSPIYKNDESGKQMVKERELFFEKQFGFRSNSLASEHFLTFDKLAQLGAKLDIEWEFIHSWYGLKWHLKPLLAKIRGTREPAKFMLIVGKKS